jgi:hypothetical protein
VNKRTFGGHRVFRGGVVAAAVAAGVLAIAGVAPAVTEQGSPPVNAGLPTISGEVRQGSTLTVKPGNWSGATPITLTHQWQQCDAAGTGCTAISGATGTTYVLVAGDVGKTIRVLETAQNADGSAQAFSAATAEVAPPNSAPANTAQPDPSGTAQDGQTITVNTGTWTGTAPITYTYAWQRCTPGTSTCSFISGATSSSYLLTSAEVGFQMRADVTATNTVGSSSAFSNLTQTVIAKGSAPANTGLPLIVGDATVGKTVTGFAGQWSGAKTFAYQWMRCNATGTGCAAIPNATQTSYTLAAADGNQTIRFKVTATNDSGSNEASSIAVHVATVSSGNSVAVTDLVARPDHLLIKEIKYSANPFGNPGGTFTIKVKVTLEGTSKVVHGALVYVVPSPSTWAKASAELPTGSDGWASLKIQTTKSLPHSGTLNMQVRARGPGTSEEAILGGISTRRLVSLKLK